MTANLLYLEDFHEGRRFTSVSREITATAIKTFAAEFDPQPFHLSEVDAHDTFFAGLAASGWHTAALTMRLLVETVPIAGGLIGGGGEIVWPRPTRPGDVLHLECTVEAVTPSRSRPDRGMITLRTETINQNNEPVQILTARMVRPPRRLIRCVPGFPLPAKAGIGRRAGRDRFKAPQPAFSRPRWTTSRPRPPKKTGHRNA